MSEMLPNIGEQDRFFSFLPLAHAAERAAVWLHSLRAGSTVTFNDTLETFTKDLQECRPTFFFCVPRLWAKFQAAIIAKFGLPLLDIYGQTEIIGGTGNTLAKRRVGSVGSAMPHFKVKIEVDGEILLGGKAIMNRYYKDPEKTAETKVGDWIHKHQVVSYLFQGTIVFHCQHWGIDPGTARLPSTSRYEARSPG